MLKLKLQYFGHLMWRTDSMEKTWILGKVEGKNRRGWGGWMASPTQWTSIWVNSGSWWWTERPGVLQSMGPQRAGHDWASELNWIMRNVEYLFMCLSVICVSFLVKSLFRSSPHFLIGLFVLILSYISCLYILEIKLCQLLHLQKLCPILRVVFLSYSI